MCVGGGGGVFPLDIILHVMNIYLFKIIHIEKGIFVEPAQASKCLPRCRLPSDDPLQWSPRLHLSLLARDQLRL